MEEVSSSSSALHDNIARKGKNAYYYAHGMKVDGPVWDGKEEPRLLSVSSIEPNSSSSGDSTKDLVGSKQKVSINDYSWLDDKMSVKIFIEHNSADNIHDDDIHLDTSNNRLHFQYRDTITGLYHILEIAELNDMIESASVRKKSSKFVISLKKSLDASWNKLKK